MLLKDALKFSSRGVTIYQCFARIYYDNCYALGNFETLGRENFLFLDSLVGGLLIRSDLVWAVGFKFFFVSAIALLTKRTRD